MAQDINRIFREFAISSSWEVFRKLYAEVIKPATKPPLQTHCKKPAIRALALFALRGTLQQARESDFPQSKELDALCTCPGLGVDAADWTSGIALRKGIGKGTWKETIKLDEIRHKDINGKTKIERPLTTSIRLSTCHFSAPLQNSPRTSPYKYAQKVKS